REATTTVTNTVRVSSCVFIAASAARPTSRVEEPAVERVISSRHWMEAAMAQNRRKFLKGAGLGIAGVAAGGAAGLARADAIGAAGGSLAVACEDLARQGPKQVIRDKRAVASSQSPIVTQTMLDILEAGGNAV